MSYVRIDPQIQSWAKTHALRLDTSSAGDETRFAYVSSIAGECFQIWIEAPRDGQVRIHAAGIESRRDDEPPQDWCVPVSDFEAALEDAFQTVVGG